MILPAFLYLSLQELGVGVTELGAAEALSPPTVVEGRQRGARMPFSSNGLVSILLQALRNLTVFTEL